MNYRGVEQLAARRAHNPKVAGSSPAPATKISEAVEGFPRPLFQLRDSRHSCPFPSLFDPLGPLAGNPTKRVQIRFPGVE